MSVTKFSNSTGDYFVGDNANDIISSAPKGFGDKPNYMYGGGGNDSMYGSYGWDEMYGGDGNDVLSDISLGLLHGEAGNDYLEITSGGGKLYGDAGNDTLTSGSGESTLKGGAGDDKFIFSKSQNFGYCEIDGGDEDFVGNTPGQANYHGHDEIIAYGDNTVIGLKSIARIDSITGHGNNTTIQTANTATRLDFSNTTLTGIAQITGLNGDDTIIGSNGNDTIFGGWSNRDALFGGAGDDLLIGNGGELTGGTGADIFKSVGAVTVKDFNAAEGDRIFVRAGVEAECAIKGNDTFVKFTQNGQSYGSITLSGITVNDLPDSWIIRG
ncbi:calcium-binding protein [Azospirillum thermophilum]|uniref:Calcium-binding protein n=1 Tax=Azospirillum thermophilum TaxID=2202148 RepID=A0A2S2CSN4_9PROT|nr:hypothetical protein [Azospirillum thermophilum]AWK87479.1 hypothetical protein DEW08_15730 [Azospirillum thermophilum]